MPSPPPRPARAYTDRNPFRGSNWEVHEYVAERMAQMEAVFEEVNSRILNPEEETRTGASSDTHFTAVSVQPPVQLSTTQWTYKMQRARRAAISPPGTVIWEPDPAFPTIFDAWNRFEPTTLGQPLVDPQGLATFTVYQVGGPSDAQFAAEIAIETGPNDTVEHWFQAPNPIVATCIEDPP